MTYRSSIFVTMENIEQVSKSVNRTRERRNAMTPFEIEAMHQKINLLTRERRNAIVMTPFEIEVLS